MRYAVFIIALLALSNAHAQMTICNGDECTREVDGEEQRLSAAEVGKIKRANARTAIGNVECSHASDVEHCEKALRELFSLFPL